MDLYASLEQTSAPQWVRGPRVRHERGSIVLEPEGAEAYFPGFAEGLAYELTAVSEPDDALAFVRRWGLLRHGAFRGSKPLRESFEQWRATVATFRTALGLYDHVQQALKGDADALDALVGIWGGLDASPFREPATDPDGVVVQASLLVAALITEGLAGTTVRFDSLAESDDDPGTFLIGAAAPDLVGFAYYELATIINGRVPIGVCEQCDRFFEVADPRQRYCGSTCASRARSRRFREAKRSEASS